MAHSTSVPYAHSSFVRRRTVSTVRRSSVLKAVIAFVAALFAAAMVSADPPSAAATPAPTDATPSNAPPTSERSLPGWLLLRDAGAADSAPAVAPQERLPLIRADRATPSGPDAVTKAGDSTATGSRSRAWSGPDAPSEDRAEDGAAAPTPRGEVEAPSADAASSVHSASTAAELASRFWKQLEALPLFVLLAGVAIAALVLRAIAARSPHGAARPEGVIEILARYPVGRRQQIVLMRVGRRVIVAHQADRAMRTLSETGDPDEVAELIAKAQAPGRDLFSRLLERRRSKVDPFADAELVDLTRGPTRPGVLGADALERPGAALRTTSAPRAGRAAPPLLRPHDGAPGR